MEQILRFAKAQATLAPVPMPDEILQKRRGKARRNSNLPDWKNDLYLDMVLSLMHTEDEQVPTFSAEQIAAAALELLYGAQQSDLPDATGLNREKKRRSPKITSSLSLMLATMRGWFQTLSSAQLQNAPDSRTRYWKIEIFEDNTTVEIPQEQAEEVLSSMQTAASTAKGSNLGSPD